MIFRRSLRSYLITAAVLLFLCGTAAATGPAAPDAGNWRHSRQLVLVTVADWNADHGMLSTFTRGRHGWVAAGISGPVTIGGKGAGWGRGLNASGGDGPVKHEGDSRSPAGVFRIGQVFGYAASAATTMPYRALSPTDYCVDVSGAQYYNRIVDAKVVGAAAVKGSTEPMRRDIHLDGDQHYRLGFEIEQNWQQKPGAGSCIFGHLWSSPADTTVGCTAMAPAVMQSLVAWLKPQRKPIFVLLPQSVYLKVRAAWGLPVIAAQGSSR